MLLVSWVLTWGGIRTICCYIHGVLQIHLRLFLCMLHSSVGSVSYMVSGCGGSIIEDKINFFFFNYEKKTVRVAPVARMVAYWLAELRSFRFRSPSYEGNIGKMSIDHTLHLPQWQLNCGCHVPRVRHTLKNLYVGKIIHSLTLWHRS